MVVESGDDLASSEFSGPSVSPTGQRVTVRSRFAGGVDLDVTAKRDTTLVILQSFSPGWTAWVDGDQVPVHAANVLFQAVRVPPGEHVVSLRYQPFSVVLGILATGFGLVGTALLLRVHFLAGV